MNHRRLLPLAALVLAASVFPAGCSLFGGSHGDDPADVARTTLVHVGDPAPDFTLATVDHGEFSLSAQRGRVVLVNFFATWCPPCREEMPHLKKRIQDRFAGKDFVMVSVAREEAADVVSPFMKKYEADWDFALDTERQAFAQYAEAYIPRNFVIDRYGKIVFEGSGFEEKDFAHMEQVIAESLGDAHREE